MTAKNVVVTGAANGIGKATALRFAAEGWSVCACDVDDHKLAELRHERISTRKLDVTDHDRVVAVVGEFAAAANGLHAFINNAGVLAHGSFCDVDVARLHRTIAINCAGVVNGARAALPHLRKTQGALVSMSSSSAVFGVPEIAVYAASKAFVSSLTEGLAIEESRRPPDDRARVVDLQPLFVDTDMVRKDQSSSSLVKSIGVKLTPDDVAKAIFASATSPSAPLHKTLAFETRAQRFLVGLSPSLGPRILDLVDKRAGKAR